MNAPRKVHFIAIGGTGMGSLAGLLNARGICVTGSDSNVYPPMSTALERWGIPVNEGFRAENALTAERPDLFVIGNAVRPDNPEAQAAIASGIRTVSFSDALYDLAMARKHRVVVSGTHGKTTTTNLTAVLLRATGRDPSFLVGGISLDFDGSFGEGDGEHFVVEGDEYDTAFFDKTPKFLHYHAETLILTSVEFDHADIYRDLEHVKSAFRELVAGMPRDGLIVAACGYENVREVVKDADCDVVSYRVVSELPADGASGSGFYARVIAATALGTRFELIGPGCDLTTALVPLHGRFNVENALGAIIAVTSLGVPLADALAALPQVRGVKRRQEVRGEAGGVTVVDDFAHHPTAVRASIEALRARYPGRRLIAIFEPRTNTSRRAIFQDEYARAFDGADRALVSEVADEPIYSATGEVTERFSASELCLALRERGVDARSYPQVGQIVHSAVSEAREGDVILVMSNGAFDNIWEKLLVALDSTPN